MPETRNQLDIAMDEIKEEMLKDIIDVEINLDQRDPSSIASDIFNVRN